MLRRGGWAVNKRSIIPNIYGERFIKHPKLPSSCSMPLGGTFRDPVKT
jgi:hypothetical protein